MQLEELMAELEAAGTAQNRTTYGRHGVTGPMFGVSYATLGKIQRRIRTDHDLALALWATGNHDARILACRIADPARVTARLADAWVRGCRDYVLTEAVGGMVAHTPVARSRSDVWRRRRDEWVAAAGWFVVACTAHDLAAWTDAELRDLVAEVEATIHDAPNRVRHEMNSALIAIGLRSAPLGRTAIAAARRIGTVVVDHGQTACKTADAEAYIQKTLARRAG